MYVSFHEYSIQKRFLLTAKLLIPTKPTVWHLAISVMCEEQQENNKIKLMQKQLHETLKNIREIK